MNMTSDGLRSSMILSRVLPNTAPAAGAVMKLLRLLRCYNVIVVFSK